MLFGEKFIAFRCSAHQVAIINGRSDSELHLPHRSAGLGLELLYFRAVAAASTPFNMASQILGHTLGYMGLGASILTLKKLKESTSSMLTGVSGR